MLLKQNENHFKNKIHVFIMTGLTTLTHHQYVYYQLEATQQSLNANTGMKIKLFISKSPMRGIISSSTRAIESTGMKTRSTFYKLLTIVRN